MPPRRSRPQATFMSDEGNRARVFESLTNVSNEAPSLTRDMDRLCVLWI